jgi:hypothetical protein
LEFLHRLGLVAYQLNILSSLVAVRVLAVAVAVAAAVEDIAHLLQLWL